MSNAITLLLAIMYCGCDVRQNNLIHFGARRLPRGARGPWGFLPHSGGASCLHYRCDAHLLTRFNKIATQGAPQMAVDKEANSLSRVYSYYSKFNLLLFYV